MTSSCEPRCHCHATTARLMFQVAALVTIAPLAACGMSGTLKRLSLVQSAVAQTAGTTAGFVSVNLTNGRYLTLAIDNWAPTAGSDDARDKALMLAKAAYAAYDLRSTLEGVTVTFPTVNKMMFVVTVRRVGDGQAFRFRSSTEDFEPLD